MNIITFLSDFGQKDSYTGSVKGTILSIDPSARIIDVSHQMDPFDIAAAAYHISCYYRCFPEKTIHLAVVDPGVGGKRKAIILETETYYFVGPDNGLFSYILEHDKYSCYNIEHARFKKYGRVDSEISTTFHARDIFAPAAAILSTGVRPEQIADKMTASPVFLSKNMRSSGSNILAELVSVDHFGNIVIAFHKKDLENFGKRGIAEVRYKDYIFKKVSETYEDVNPGEPILIWGSSGHLEISVNRGNAAEYFDTKKNEDKVTIRI